VHLNDIRPVSNLPETVINTEKVSEQLTTSKITNIPGLGAMSQSPQTPRQNDIRQERRNMAKKALQELNRRSIGYVQISREGFDINLLRQLYIESGISIPPEDSSDIITETRPSQNGQSRRSSTLESGEMQSTTKITPEPRPEIPREEPSKAISNGDVAVQDIPSPNPVFDNTSKKSGPSATKKPTISTNGDRSLDRKDYIAKLLAAKEAVKQSPTTQKPPITESISPNLNQQNSTKVITPVESQVSGPRGTDIKDPTQTEIIRQRLEALKNSRKTQIVPSMPNSGLPESQLQFAQSNVDNVHTAADESNISSAESNSVTQTVFFAPTLKKSVSGLPGLLPGLIPSPTAMTMVPRQEADVGHVTTSSLAQDEPFDDVFGEDSISSVDREEDSSSKTQQFFSKATETSTPLEPSRELRKRAVAADFIDSPPKLSRRPTSSDPIQLVIEVSDDEDEDMADDGPDSDFLNTLSSGMAWEQSVADRDTGFQQDQGNLSSMSGFQSRTSSYTTPKIQTPSLADHEEKIRMMRIKIAEMEQRKKGKQALNSSTNPDSRSSPAILDSTLIKNIEYKQQNMETVNDQLAEKERILAAAKLEIRKKLMADRQGRALINANAERERREAERATSTTEIQARLNRRAELEAALPSLDAQINEAESKLEAVRKQEEEITIELRRGNEGREALRRELSEILRALETEEVSTNSKPATSIISPVQELPTINTQETLQRSIPTDTQPVLRTSSEVEIPNPHHESTVSSNLNDSTLPAIDTTAKNDSKITDEVIEREVHDDSDYNKLQPADSNEQQYNDSVSSGSPDNNTFPDTITRESSEKDMEDSNDDYEPMESIQEAHLSQEPDPTRDGLPPSFQGIVDDEESSPSLAPSLSHGSVQEDQQIEEETVDESDDYEPPEPSFLDTPTNNEATTSIDNISQVPISSNVADKMDLDEDISKPVLHSQPLIINDTGNDLTSETPTTELVC
jgi:hypothetical protein